MKRTSKSKSGKSAVSQNPAMKAERPDAELKDEDLKKVSGGLIALLDKQN